MKKTLIVITALIITGCQEQQCYECVQSITTKWFNSNSTVIKVERDSVVFDVCDEQEAEGWDGAFLITEENIGNQGYYKQTTKSTSCN